MRRPGASRGEVRDRRLIKQFQQRVQRQLVPLDYGHWHTLVDDDGLLLQAKLKRAGHILSSGYLEVSLQSRKQKGSNNRAKAKQKVARRHAKIADARLDHLHKLTRQIVNENQVICAESLAVKNMVKNRSLAKAISDVGWGELVRQLEYKAAWAGRQFVQIDRWYPSSKRCHGCGFVLETLSLDVRTWDCPDCGTQGINRDVNAARNILQAGTALLVGAES